MSVPLSISMSPATHGPFTAATIGFCAVLIALRNWNTGLVSECGGDFTKSSRSLPAVKISG